MILKRTTIRLTLADQAADRYPCVPFRIPSETESIGVSLELDRRADGTGIDMGLLGPDGLRGWSGGATSSLGTSSSGPDDSQLCLGHRRRSPRSRTAGPMAQATTGSFASSNPS